MAKTDSRLPSGGIKSSGFGRECSSFGIKEFVNVKSFSYKWIYLEILILI